MMSWSPTSRRYGVSGAVQLFTRAIWRDSLHGPDIERIVRAAIDDDDRVSRLHAAHAVRLLEPNVDSQLRLLRGLLLRETDSYVSSVLASELVALAPDAPNDVDAVLDELTTSRPWKARLAATDDDELETVGSFVDLVLWLALAENTPSANEVAKGWARHPVDERVARRMFFKLRPWLSLPASRAVERSRAFHLARVAAEELEALRVSTDAEDAVDIYTVADTLVDQLYFASGAFGTNDNNRVPEPAPEGFTEEALSVINLLTGFRRPTITQHLILTLGYLSPSAPKEAFLLVERSIDAGDPYTYDGLAARTTTALIERYLAEHREFIAADSDLLTAVRQVLDAFVRVGWPAAISVSYRLGEAFR